MPRSPRKVSSTGFYHVVIKGNNGRILFEDDADHQRFLGCMERAKDKYAILYHAWCLMSNHVHLLVQDLDADLAPAMHAIDRGYTEHYRLKYEHKGALYTGRYWSEPVEKDSYALCAMRYIHQNPYVAGICITSKYKWSSIHDYLGRPSASSSLSTTEMLLDMCGGVAGLIRFHKQAVTAKPFANSGLKAHLGDEEMQVVACAALGRATLSQCEKMPAPERDAVVQKLSDVGFTLRQISRLTAIPTTVIHRILKKS